MKKFKRLFELTGQGLLLTGFCLSIVSMQAQSDESRLLKDAKTGCGVWFKHMYAEDSITWTGACKDGLADGKGTLLGFTQGAQTCRYVGAMSRGRFDGQGLFLFWGDRKLEGHFVMGEPIFLKEELRRNLETNVVSNSDSSQAYIGDENSQELYYHALMPKAQVKGTVVLMPGTWETTGHLLSSMSVFCELAHENGLAVLVLSINQRLTLTDNSIELMNTMFRHAIQKYGLPKDKIVLGGWSMGGLFSLRYTELSRQDSGRTAIVPKAVFSCDGPCDLENLYKNFSLKLYKNPSQSEPFYGLRELRKYCGGSPDSARERYIHYSVYSRSSATGGNVVYLRHVPVRIYGDVDPVWWMHNRHVDMYDLNALDQTAMIQLLNDLGNEKAEFVNAFQKGYRLEGNRHPHSWSIVDPDDCIKWVLECIES